MGDKTWKAVERAICGLLGGIRTGPVGKDGPDCVLPNALLAVQIKHRATVPNWLTGAMDQTIHDAGGAQYPILILHEKGTKYEESLVITRLSDFIDYDGSLDITAVETPDLGHPPQKRIPPPTRPRSN